MNKVHFVPGIGWQWLNPDGQPGEDLFAPAEDRGDLLKKDADYHREKMRAAAKVRDEQQKVKAAEEKAKQELHDTQDVKRGDDSAHQGDPKSGFSVQHGNPGTDAAVAGSRNKLPQIQSSTVNAAGIMGTGTQGNNLESSTSRANGNGRTHRGGKKPKSNKPKPQASTSTHPSTLTSQSKGWGKSGGDNMEHSPDCHHDTSLTTSTLPKTEPSSPIPKTQSHDHLASISSTLQDIPTITRLAQIQSFLTSQVISSSTSSTIDPENLIGTTTTTSPIEISPQSLEFPFNKASLVSFPFDQNQLRDISTILTGGNGCLRQPYKNHPIDLPDIMLPTQYYSQSDPESSSGSSSSEQNTRNLSNNSKEAEPLTEEQPEETQPQHSEPNVNDYETNEYGEEIIIGKDGYKVKRSVQEFIDEVIRSREAKIANHRRTRKMERKKAAGKYKPGKLRQLEEQMK